MRTKCFGNRLPHGVLQPALDPLDDEQWAGGRASADRKLRAAFVEPAPREDSDVIFLFEQFGEFSQPTGFRNGFPPED